MHFTFSMMKTGDFLCYIKAVDNTDSFDQKITHQVDQSVSSAAAEIVSCINAEGVYHN